MRWLFSFYFLFVPLFRYLNSKIYVFSTSTQSRLKSISFISFVFVPKKHLFRMYWIYNKFSKYFWSVKNLPDFQLCFLFQKSGKSLHQLFKTTSYLLRIDTINKFVVERNYFNFTSKWNNRKRIVSNWTASSIQCNNQEAIQFKSFAKKLKIDVTYLKRKRKRGQKDLITSFRQNEINFGSFLQYI